MSNPIISPSILSADFCRLGEDMNALKKAGCDTIHVDVMDGMFVPNISFGQVVLNSIHKSAPLPLDVHLMVHEPGRFIDEFALDSVQSITVHAEACAHLDRTLQQIAETGKKPGVALNPATPLSAIDWVLDKLWMVMIMTVNPGFGGQAFIPLYEKIAFLRREVDNSGLDTIIGVDGGIDRKTAPRVLAAGADYLVSGSYVFKGEKTVKAAVDFLKNAENLSDS
jgi:ribulose-phosphate 3-epimerase